MRRKELLDDSINVIDKRKAFDLSKPRFNPYQTGHGILDDTKYNRNKNKCEFIRILKDDLER